MNEIDPPFHKELMKQLIEKANFSQVDLDHLYQKFSIIDTDKNGQIEANEISSIPGMDQNPLMCRILHASDLNRDGGIDFYEFCASLSTFSRNSTKEQKEIYLFRIFDVNNDGFIDKDDLIYILNLVTKNENLSQTQIEDLAKNTIARSDFDFDGKLSFPEFVSAISVIDFFDEMQFSS